MVDDLEGTVCLMRESMRAETDALRELRRGLGHALATLHSGEPARASGMLVDLLELMDAIIEAKEEADAG
jgi:hypothetical protein